MTAGGEQFDYVIVGAGSAGCVVANRLSADPSCRVLLLEAGRDERRKETWIPAAWPKLFKSDCDSAYGTDPSAAHARGGRDDRREGIGAGTGGGARARH